MFILPVLLLTLLYFLQQVTQHGGLGLGPASAMRGHGAGSWLDITAEPQGEEQGTGNVSLSKHTHISLFSFSVHGLLASVGCGILL